MQDLNHLSNSTLTEIEKDLSSPTKVQLLLALSMHDQYPKMLNKISENRYYNGVNDINNGIPQGTIVVGDGFVINLDEDIYKQIINEYLQVLHISDKTERNKNLEKLDCKLLDKMIDQNIEVFKGYWLDKKGEQSNIDDAQNSDETILGKEKTIKEEKNNLKKDLEKINKIIQTSSYNTLQADLFDSDISKNKLQELMEAQKRKTRGVSKKSDLLQELGDFLEGLLKNDKLIEEIKKETLIKDNNNMPDGLDSGLSNENNNEEQKISINKINIDLNSDNVLNILKSSLKFDKFDMINQEEFNKILGIEINDQIKIQLENIININNTNNLEYFYWENINLLADNLYNNDIKPNFEEYSELLKQSKGNELILTYLILHWWNKKDEKNYYKDVHQITWARLHAKFLLNLMPKEKPIQEPKKTEKQLEAPIEEPKEKPENLIEELEKAEESIEESGKTEELEKTTIETELCNAEKQCKESVENPSRVMPGWRSILEKIKQKFLDLKTRFVEGKRIQKIYNKIKTTISEFF